MKKLIIAIICCSVFLGCFYLLKNKDRLYMKYKHRNDPNGYVYYEGKEEEEAEPKKETPSNENKQIIDELKKTVEQLVESNKKLSEKVTVQNDTIYSLTLRIDSLNTVLASKPKLKIQSSPYDYSNFKNSKPVKNEKNLPIARSNSAMQLKEFFTERYDNRR